MTEPIDHKVRAAVLREGAEAIVAENDRMLWATTPGKHWAADLLTRMAETSDAVREQGALPVPAGAELPMTPEVARVRLTQYGERTKTWSTATYDSGTERALHEIAVTLLAEADALRARLAKYERPAEADGITRRIAPTQALRDNEPAEQAPVTIYRAEHPDSGIALGHYATETAARAHCEATERRSWPAGTTLAFDWIEDDEDRVAELVVTAGQNEESTTGYIVTALEVPSEYDEEADE